MSAKERRRHYRRKLADEIILYDAAGKNVVGTVDDLSDEGLRIHARQNFDRGSELDLKMVLPEGWCEVNELDFTAQCCWQDHADDSHDAGLRIVDINETEAFVIQEILDLYGSPVAY